MSKRAQRDAWYAELVGLGMPDGDASAIANNPNFDFASKAFNHAKGVYSAHQAKARQPAAPQAPKPIARDTNPRRVSDNNEGGSNLRIKKKSRKRRQELSKGTGQLRINPTQTTNVSTAGTAARSGGINI